jgi:two-component system response regulator DegU
VDDHLSARTAIRSLLDWHGFQVWGEARDGKEAIEKVLELKPDIVLLDINLPEMNGIRVASQIRQVAPSTKIVFLTIHTAPQTKNAARAIGADAFVSKSTATTDLIPALARLVNEPTSSPVL